MPSAVDHHVPVHDHVFDPIGELSWVVVGRIRADARRVEDDDVRSEPVA
jgi:hypothetical protein